MLNGEDFILYTVASHATSKNQPVGYILSLGGTRVYHAGDTALFSDMKLLGDIYEPDVAMIPIGDLFTMGPKEAAIAADLIGADTVFPMHYGTLPKLTRSVDEFKAELKSIIEVKVLAPGHATDIG